jgi:3-oxoacyl-[acyl-carrier-protein] synthase-3
MSHAELATLHGTTERNVSRVIGSSRIYVSEESAVSLAVRAARSCLANAGIAPEDVDAVVWCGASRRHSLFAAAGAVQEAIGAHRAFTFDLGNNCSETLTAFRLARALIADDATVKRVLVVTGETWAEHIPRRTIDPVTDKNHQNVMSDGGAAVLIGPSERAQLIGFGFSALGKYWDLMTCRFDVVEGKAYERCVFKPDFPPDAELAIDLTKLFRLALDRCLASAGIEKSQIDHLVLPLSGPPMQVGFARALGLPPERIVRMSDSPTHIGAPDMVYGLEMLYRSGRGSPGQHVLLAARSIGIMRFGIVRL